MQFDARQMREDALLKKGRYPFRVLRATEKTTAAGNDMLKLDMMLICSNREVRFFDNLVLTPGMFWKFEHFCESTGLEGKISEGTLFAQDCDGREGFLEIDHRVNSETGVVEARVKDYLKPDVQADDFFNDDIQQ